MKPYFPLLITSILFVNILAAQTKPGYDTAFYRKLQEKRMPKGMKPGDAEKMTDEEQMKQYMQANGMTAPKAGTSTTKPSGNTLAPAATTTTTTAAYIESAPTMPSALSTFMSETFINSQESYLNKIKEQGAALQIANNKIAGANMAKRYPMSTGNQNEAVYLKQIMQFQQGKDGSILSVDVRRQLVRKIADDSVKKLTAGYAREYEPISKMLTSNDPTTEAKGQKRQQTLDEKYTKRVQANKEAVFKQWAGVYNAYKSCYTIHCSRADALMATANYYANVQGMTVRNNARSLPMLFVGHAIQLMALLDEGRALIGAIHY